MGEATGKIVCANCHLAKKLTQAEVPQSVLPDSVFTASVKVPYENGLQEIGADGSDVGLQVGAVVMLPDGFTLAPLDRRDQGRDRRGLLHPVQRRAAKHPAGGTDSW